TPGQDIEKSTRLQPVRVAANKTLIFLPDALNLAALERLNDGRSRSTSARDRLEIAFCIAPQAFRHHIQHRRFERAAESDRLRRFDELIDARYAGIGADRENVVVVAEAADPFK